MLAVYDVVKRLVDIARDRGIAQTALVPVPDGEER
jgi:hypothetical protein